MLTKSWTKAKMIERLFSYGIPFSYNDLKSELLMIIQQRHVTPKYIINKKAAVGHEVVQFPMAHCTLNPIELAWAQVKGHIKSNPLNLTSIIYQFN